MADVQFDRYYNYDDLTGILKQFESEYPQLCTLVSIGTSHEGRSIPLVEITNSKTGPAADKPAMWVDGNIHATELAPSSACLYAINKLIRRYGQDPQITRVLDTRAFYICPRLNPDGAELILSDRLEEVRSGTRPWPFDEDPTEGLEARDVDGDGRILSMRIPDPDGQWKTSEADPRLMVRRDPAESGGQYYRVLREGRVKDFDGIRIDWAKKKQGLDFNRNFPANWRGEGEQIGAGPYPGSEPEVRAAVDFITAHRNITGGVAFHTWSGVILRPFETHPDDDFAPEDLWVYKEIGEKATEITGYPVYSVYHDFRYHPKQVITGGFDEWLFSHLGLFSWTVEIWSPQRQAGVEPKHYIDWYRNHPIEDDIKMIKWSDEKLDGKGYIDWYPFEHPDLGSVELGGWDYLYCWRNPPGAYLEAEIAPFTDWLVWHLAISPCLEIFKTEVEQTGQDSWLVKMSVQNNGWLPTYVSKQAIEKKIVRGVCYEIDIPEGAALLSGKKRVIGEQLEGRSYSHTAVTPWTMFQGQFYPDRASVEWVIKAPSGTELMLTASHERAGKVHTAVVLT